MTVEAQRPAEPAGTKHSGLRRLEPLLWLGPTVVLVLGVVIYPMYEMFDTSRRRVTAAGLTKQGIGVRNYERLFSMPNLSTVLIHTAIWVVCVVGLTIVVSWPIALLLNAKFPGRTLVRYSVLLPWAASLVMTSLVMRWAVNTGSGAVGAVNRILGFVGVEPINWLGSVKLSWVVLIVVGVYVSVPFTVYTMLAGLATIPEDVYQAAKIDGAGGWRTFTHITVPMTRSATFVAVALNIVGVFNSFPIIWMMTEGGPDQQTHTTITYMYELAFGRRDMGAAAALSVLNLGVLIVVVAGYLTWYTKRRKWAM